MEKLQFGERLPEYNIETFIVYIPKNYIITNDGLNVTWNQTNGSNHEAFHWIQHHGTTIGALLSLIKFSQEQTILRWFPRLPLDIQKEFFEKRNNGNRIIPIDENTFDLPPFEDESDYTSVFFRMLHDHLLVHTMLFDSDLQDDIKWPRNQSFAEVIADTIISCETLGLVKYPGNSIARKAYYPIGTPIFLKCDDGIRFTTRSIMELAAIVNELLIEFQIAAIDSIADVNLDKINKRIFEGTIGSAVRLFQQITSINSEELYQWLLSIEIICDISLNPPLPPIVIDFDTQLSWSDIYPPTRFNNLALELNNIGPLHLNANDDAIKKYYDDVCKRANLKNPNEYIHPYNSKTDKINYARISEEELSTLIINGKFIYIDYILWIQSKFFNLRNSSPTLFVNYSRLLLSNFEVQDDYRIRAWSDTIKTGTKWLTPQLFWIEDNLATEENQLDNSNLLLSTFIMERAKYMAAYDFIFELKNNELNKFPPNLRTLLFPEIYNWLNDNMLIHIDYQFSKDTSSINSLIESPNNKNIPLTKSEWQNQIKVGDYIVELVQWDDGILVIYHEVITTDSELDDRYRIVCAYSEKVTDGETGLFQIKNAFGLFSKQSFEQARKLNWPSSWITFISIALLSPDWSLVDENKIIYEPKKNQQSTTCGNKTVRFQ